jgi:hypothetical protein
MREVVYTMIAGNPHIKNEDKPKRPRDIHKISDDKEPEVNKDIQKITEQDLKVYEALNYGTNK